MFSYSSPVLCLALLGIVGLVSCNTVNAASRALPAPEVDTAIAAPRDEVGFPSRATCRLTMVSGELISINNVRDGRHDLSPAFSVAPRG